MSQKLINTTYQYIADYLLGAKNQAVELLQVNGVDIDASASQAAVQSAFLTAIGNSPSFRAQAAKAILAYENSKQSSFTGARRNYSFGGQQTPTGHIHAAGASFQSPFETRTLTQFTGPGATDYLNSIDDPNASDYYGSDPLVGPSDTAGDAQDTPIAQPFNAGSLTIENPDTNTVNTTVLPNAAPNASVNPNLLNPNAVAKDIARAPAGSSSSTSGLSGLLQSGLNLVSTKLATDAQKAQAQSAVQLAQANLASKALSPTSGSTLTTVLIVVAVLGVLGGVGYAIFHKKKG